jgi:hypothetical protein
VRLTPLPFICLHEAYIPGEVDAHGNTTPGWREPAEVACMWWPVASDEPPGPPTGSERVVGELALVVDVAIPIDQRDKFTVKEQLFEVAGLAKNYDYGPFGFAPNRKVIELRMVR